MFSCQAHADLLADCAHQPTTVSRLPSSSLNDYCSCRIPTADRRTIDYHGRDRRAGAIARPFGVSISLGMSAPSASIPHHVHTERRARLGVVCRFFPIAVSSSATPQSFSHIGDDTVVDGDYATNRPISPVRIAIIEYLQ